MKVYQIKLSFITAKKKLIKKKKINKIWGCWEASYLVVAVNPELELTLKIRKREREGKKRSKINQYLTKLEILCTHRSIAKPG